MRRARRLTIPARSRLGRLAPPSTPPRASSRSASRLSRGRARASRRALPRRPAERGGVPRSRAPSRAPPRRGAPRASPRPGRGRGASGRSRSNLRGETPAARARRRPSRSRAPPPVVERGGDPGATPDVPDDDAELIRPGLGSRTFARGSIFCASFAPRRRRSGGFAELARDRLGARASRVPPRRAGSCSRARSRSAGMFLIVSGAVSVSRRLLLRATASAESWSDDRFWIRRSRSRPRRRRRTSATATFAAGISFAGSEAAQSRRAEPERSRRRRGGGREALRRRGGAVRGRVRRRRGGGRRPVPRGALRREGSKKPGSRCSPDRDVARLLSRSAANADRFRRCVAPVLARGRAR